MWFSSKENYVACVVMVQSTNETEKGNSVMTNSLLYCLAARELPVV